MGFIFNCVKNIKIIYFCFFITNITFTFILIFLLFFFSLTKTGKKWYFFCSLSLFSFLQRVWLLRTKTEFESFLLLLEKFKELLLFILLNVAIFSELIIFLILLLVNKNSCCGLYDFFRVKILLLEFILLRLILLFRNEFCEGIFKFLLKIII